MFASGVLVFFGLSFLAFGVWALVAPVSLAGLIHFGLETSGSVTEIRAFYGGLEIGFALFLFAAALNRELAPAALLALVAVTGGIALARVVGLIVDQSGSTLMYGALAFELAGAVMGLLAWLNLDK